MYSIIDLLSLTQYQAYCKVKQVINKFKKETVRFKDSKYLVMNVEVNKPKPMLCIHLDTINTLRGKDLNIPSNYFHYDVTTKTYSLSTIGKSQLSCLGGDDRAGLWLVMQVLADKELSHKYCYGIFFDEESGGKGSTKYMKDFPDYEDGVSCFIGLDRRGSYECATYGSDNKELIDTLETLGYIEAYGSFTDASNLAFEKACINLSVGYAKEHTTEETLNMTYAKQTLDVLKVLHTKLTKPAYEVEATTKQWGYSSYYKDEQYTGFSNIDNHLDRKPVFCVCCGTHSPLYEADNGYMLCGDCIDFYDKGY